MNGLTDKTAVVIGASRAVAASNAGPVAREFTHAIVLDGRESVEADAIASDTPTAGRRAGCAWPDLDMAVLRLDTYGRPLRDWDD
jgi:NAD(P)-dependent dehydrogenase (short-subunit alcohol dehydrogenase family)